MGQLPGIRGQIPPHAPNTPRASPAPQTQQQTNRRPKTTASGVQKHYCDHHQRYVLHTTAECSLGQNSRPNTATGNQSPRNLQSCTYHPGRLVAHSTAECRNNPANQVIRRQTAQTRETPRLGSDGCPLLDPPSYRQQPHDHHRYQEQTRHSTDRYWSHQVIHGDQRRSRSRANTPPDESKDLRSRLTHLRRHQPLADYSATFFLLANVRYPIILGLDTLKNLPFCVTLDGQRIFSGFQTIKPINEVPQAEPGEGITFVNGSPAEQNAIANLLTTYKDNIFQWSGKHGLFPQHIASIPTNGQDPEPPRRIRLSPDKIPAMTEILANYTKAGIIEPAQSTLNSIQLRKVPDPGQRAEIIDQYHVEMGHTNWKKTFDTIRRRFTWPGMRTDIFHHVLQCAKCFTFNSATAAVGTKLTPVPPADKHDRLGVDFWGPFPPSTKGNRYDNNSHAIDYYSRRVVTTPVKRATANALCSFLADVFAQMGTFEIIHLDGAAVFNSAPDISQELKLVKARHQKYRKRYINQANKNRRPAFKLGQMVTLRPRLKTTEKHAANRRFLPKRFGPFRITAVLGEAKYRIQTPIGDRQANAWELQPYNFPVAPPLTIPKHLDIDKTDRPQFRLDPGTLDTTSKTDDKAQPVTSSPAARPACNDPNTGPATPGRDLPRTPTGTSPISSVNIPQFDSPPQQPTPSPHPDLTTDANAADSPAPVAPNRQWRKRQRTSSPAAGPSHNPSMAPDPSPTTTTSHSHRTSTGSPNAQGP
ncbi:unnamed protein product [Notodromas monacha]|uniref:RNA-directed DNA polymerase n=1 Tax=Notodromas monacha TaxID=399045 RepID=A0A7R9BVL8_9CRUS|nr:unnamed protein product [Notodromas monacha]CAG0922599.1 unnamed protein product [Notodromas monacha]